MPADATPAPLTCSVGLVQWNGVESADKLIGRADGALYQTKMRGRDRLISVPVPDNVRSLFSSPGSTKRVMLVS